MQTRRFHVWGFWTLVLAAGLATSGSNCNDKCSGKNCNKAESCDPTDGVCKCGPQAGADGGVGGTTCATNETCDLNLQTCVSSLCDNKLCSNGNICDRQDGLCKCGGGTCPSNQICDNTSHQCVGAPACEGVICGSGSSCNPKNGQCECLGKACGAGNVCLGADGGCQPDPCYGVHCTAADEGILCIQGVCRCGKNGSVSVNDPVCSRVQHCQGGSCNTILGCDAVPPCYGYDVCSPGDLQCHCGSRLGPICKAGEICQSYGLATDPAFNGDAGPDAGQFFACRAVNDCHTIVCGQGEICDPNRNFNCICETAEGLEGPACDQNQFCVALPALNQVKPSCYQQCSPYVQQECQGANVGADAGLLNCYAELATNAGICEPPNAIQTTIGGACGSNNDCVAGLGCYTRVSIVNGDAGPMISTCQPYCNGDVGLDGGNFCPDRLTQHCYLVGHVEVTGQSIDVGFCQ